MIRELTCIVCPMGCSLKVTCGEDGQIEAVTGNTCKRGDEYARAECTNPTRTVTTTVRSTDGGVVPVKTTLPIPKDSVMDCMKLINSCRVQLPIRVGDVIIKGVLGTEADVVATANC